MRLPWVTRAEWKAIAAERVTDLRFEEDRHRATKDMLVAAEAARALWQRWCEEAQRDFMAARAAHAEAYAALEARYAALVAQVVDLKRHDAGLPPAAFDATLLDPMNSLGPKTQLAVDEFAAGDPEMRKWLVARAHLEQAALRGQSNDMEQIDEDVAAMVRRGDQ